MKYAFKVLIIVSIFCSCDAIHSVGSESPNTLLPQIMHNGIIYYLNSSRPSDIEFELTEDTPRVKSIVPLTQVPHENGQANFGVTNTSYTTLGDMLYVFWNKEWMPFVTFEQLNS